MLRWSPMISSVSCRSGLAMDMGTAAANAGMGSPAAVPSEPGETTADSSVWVWRAVLGAGRDGPSVANSSMV